MEDEATKFCVSWFTMKVINVAITMFVTSWNSHPIPGKFFCHCFNLISSFLHVCS